MTSWDRAAVVADLNDRLWTYLSASASQFDLEGFVEDVWRLPPGELNRVASVHLVSRRSTQDVLEAAAALLKVLPSSVTRSETILFGTVRGPVVWDETLRYRWRTGDPQAFVCRPPERRYDTPLGRLVLHALTRVHDLAILSGLETGGLAEQLRQTAATAEHLRSNRKLDEVTPVKSIPERTLNSLARNRLAQPLIDFVRAAREAIDARDHRTIADVISTQLLAPATDDALYELLVGFRIVDHLSNSGYEIKRLSAVGGTPTPFARLVNPACSITIWWQRSLWSLPFSKLDTSVYQSIAAAAGLRKSSLRPDFVLWDETNHRLLLVEVKHSLIGSNERQGVTDVLAYIHDAEDLVTSFPAPHALVVAYNASGTPGEADVMISDEDNIDVALEIAGLLPGKVAASA